MPNSSGRSFQRRGAAMDMALLKNVRWEVTESRDRVRQDEDRVERVWWIFCGSFNQWNDLRDTVTYRKQFTVSVECLYITSNYPSIMSRPFFAFEQSEKP